MTKAVWTGAVAVAVVCLSSPVLAQQTDQKTVTINAAVNAKAKLAVSGGPVNFPDDDPDLSPTLTSTTPISVDVKARTSASGNVTLTVLATDDLKSGTDVITIGNLSWTASGLTAGTMSKTAAFTIGSWTGSGLQSGTQTYELVNSWTYKTGTYSSTITYTLTAP